MDFSQAERAGFIKAFIHFWTTRPKNNRLPPELEQAGEKLLKGCLEHFRTGVNRLCRMSGVIPPDRVEEFRGRALGLTVQGFTVVQRGVHPSCRGLPENPRLDGVVGEAITCVHAL